MTEAIGYVIINEYDPKSKPILCTSLEEGKRKLFEILQMRALFELGVTDEKLNEAVKKIAGSEKLRVEEVTFRGSATCSDKKEAKKS